MVLPIIIFVFAFIVKCWTSMFYIRGEGYLFDAPPILQTQTGGCLIDSIGMLLVLLSFIMLMIHINSSWVIKIPIGLIVLWLVYWELPAFLFGRN